jgi:hypothetical protein
MNEWIFAAFSEILIIFELPKKRPFTNPKTRGWVDFLKNPGFFPTLLLSLLKRHENLKKVC